MSKTLRNPFRPSFGTTPPLLAGRETAVLAFGDALDAGPGSPGRATLYTGPRGVGKTVMLNEAESQAKERGWMVVSETASPGLVDRLVAEGLPEAAAALELEDGSRRLSGVTLPFELGGVEFDVDSPDRVAGLRSQLNRLTDHLDGRGTGVLITIDEVHASARTELRTLGAVIQHGFREERPVAIAAAGLPSAVTELLNDEVLTFLRRADRQVLGAVADADVADALSRPIAASGRSIESDALEVAVAATGGYPFLVQLIGYWTWQGDTTTTEITRDQAVAGVQAARRRMGSLVHEPALYDLSAVDRTFLAAMAHDDRASKMASIAERMHASTSYASQYRLRLIAAGMIQPAGHGYVDFALPYLRDYLREHAATFGL